MPNTDKKALKWLCRSSCWSEQLVAAHVRRQLFPHWGHLSCIVNGLLLCINLENQFRSVKQRVSTNTLSQISRLIFLSTRISLFCSSRTVSNKGYCSLHDAAWQGIRFFLWLFYSFELVAECNCSISKTNVNFVIFLLQKSTNFKFCMIWSNNFSFRNRNV